MIEGWGNVFHEEHLLGKANRFACFVRQRIRALPRLIHSTVYPRPLYYTGRHLHKSAVMCIKPVFCVPVEIVASIKIPAATRIYGYDAGPLFVLISGMIRTTVYGS
jgi:hypothetical protein